MARTHKEGIDYFSFDIDFFNDEKIEFVSARFGVKGEVMAIRLLCKIYRNGYYTVWNEDESIILSKRAGEAISPALVSDIVIELVKRGFFNKTIFDKFKILTSNGIQKRYFEATKRYQSINVISEYLLVNVSNLHNVHIIPLNVHINPEYADINSQIEKEKETERKLKEKEKKESADFLSKIIGAFQESYFEIFQADYVVMGNGKERAAASKLLQAYKKKYPGAKSEEAISGLKEYFKLCCSVPDEWLQKNMSLPIIVSKFNEINNAIKNGKWKIRSVASRSAEVDAIFDAVYDSKGIK